MTTTTRLLLAPAIAACISFLPQADAHEFGTKTWDFTYDGGGADIGYVIRFDSQGRLAVGGWLDVSGKAQDALVFQVTPGPGSTAVNWDETRDVTGTVRNDRFYSLAIDSNDSIICTGVASGPSAPYAQPITEKFFPDGTTDWQDVWNPSAVGGTEAFSTDIAINADDEAFASTYYDVGGNNWIYWGVRKYVTSDPGPYTGTLETAYTYANSTSYTYSNRIEGIALGDNGALCTVGRIGESGAARRTWHVRLYGDNDQMPAAPELKWSHTLQGSASGHQGFARRVAIDNDGNPVVVGAFMYEPGVWTGRIVKYNQAPDPDSVPGTPVGEPAWTVEKLNTKGSFYSSVFIDRMGYYWAGGNYTDNDDSARGTLVRLDPADGTILNELVWDGVSPQAFDIRDRRLAVVINKDGDILVEYYTPDPPEITLAGDAVIELEVHSDFTEPGFSAYDEFEREDLTSAVVVTGLPDTTTVGSYTVRYNVDAHNGDSAVEVTRTVNIVDTTAPEITLQGGADIRVDAGVDYHEPGFDVTDNYDMSLGGSVVVTGNLDTSVPGTYTLIYNVSDANGNPAAAVMRTVRVVQLKIDTVEITDADEVRITCQTERGASYRILASTDMQDSPWEELAVVETPEGTLDWSTLRTGAWKFLKVQRVVDP